MLSNTLPLPPSLIILMHPHAPSCTIMHASQAEIIERDVAMVVLSSALSLDAVLDELNLWHADGARASDIIAMCVDYIQPGNSDQVCALLCTRYDAPRCNATHGRHALERRSHWGTSRAATTTV